MANEERDRNRARQLAKESLAAGDPTGWFERLYQESAQGAAVVPWADKAPNPNLISWWESGPGVSLEGRKALVVGCGLGDDAEQLAQWGALVTAFDVAPSAVAAARARFQDSKVDYQVADLLHPPADWKGKFDFIFECYTLQALPGEVRGHAIEQVAGMVAPGGHLLVVARARDDEDPAGEMPWPLTRQELMGFERLGFEYETWEDYMDGATRRFRVLYRRL